MAGGGAMVETPFAGHQREPFPLSVLSDDEVHVWTIHLDVEGWRDVLAPEHLSADELLRVERFALERDSRRFAVCRATLRTILGCYLERRPCELAFRSGPYGKPYVDAAGSGESILFNVSHSDELALVA